MTHTGCQSSSTSISRTQHPHETDMGHIEVDGAILKSEGYEGECPRCGTQPRRREYDRHDDGSISSYWSIWCFHCGYEASNDTDDDPF